MGGTLYTIVILVAIAACVGFLVWNKKKQAGSAPSAPAKGGARGIIK